MSALLNGEDDVRMFVHTYENEADKARDWKDWKDTHQLELKYQRILRNNGILGHFSGARALELGQYLRRQFFLGYEDVMKILKHIFYNNKHITVDTLGQDDERKFMIYLKPRFKHNVVHPYCILNYDYYEQMKMVRGEQDPLVW